MAFLIGRAPFRLWGRVRTGFPSTFDLNYFSPFRQEGRLGSGPSTCYRPTSSFSVQDVPMVDVGRLPLRRAG